jgi:hypothetical protein
MNGNVLATLQNKKDDVELVLPPNFGLQPTANSHRSYVAAATSSS